MSDFLPGMRKAIPAIVMAAGCGTFFSPDTPKEVKAGGACLLAVAMILVDLQSGKKLGYTDKIVGALRKVPGLQNASEGEILGCLTLGASCFLGGGTAVNMYQSGEMHPGWINQAYNYISYPLGAAFDIGRTRRFLESKLGTELSFTYKDENGNTQKTEPISTTRLLQQIAYLSGAVGVGAFGYQLDNAGIEFTGVMFALSNGMGIAGLTKEPIKEVTAAKMGALKKALETYMAEANGIEIDSKTAALHWEALKSQWASAAKSHAEGRPVTSVDVKSMVLSFAASLAAGVQEAWLPPAKRASREV